MRKLLALAIACLSLAAGGYVAYLKFRTPRSADTTAGQQEPASDSARRASGRAASTSGQPPAGSAASPESPPPATPVRWLNIAAAALGGHIERVSSEASQGVFSVPYGWSAAHAIDYGAGSPFINCAALCGWASKDSSVPQEIVLSFYQRREAVISRVVIDTLTPATSDGSRRLPKQVEVSVSRSSADDGFTQVASVELSAEAGPRAIDFVPTPAKYLRVRILSSYGGEVIAVGEISVFEADGPTPSILADFPRNLALFALGGALVYYTSDYAANRAFRVMDGDPAQEWRSGGELSFPQDFIFAFHDDAVVLIDRVVLTNKYAATGAKVVSIWTSLRSPVDGFEEAGRFTLKETTDAQSFPIHGKARFVKLRILEAFRPTDFVSLGEVQLIEGSEAGYESVLFRRAEPPAALAEDAGRRGPNDSAAIATEHEKNDQISEANRLELGAAIQGRIDPIGELDYFKVSVPGPARSMLTVDLSGEPNIRTSLSLVNAADVGVRQFDPSRAAAEQVAFSWLVDPGEYALRVTQPLASVVVVWDTSGSMNRSVKDLQTAVEGYLDQVTSAERVNLMRFSKAGWTLTRPDIEVLLPEFSNDRQRLKKATEGKFAADGGTPFYDAMAKAMSLLDGVGGNRAIIVMTDGEDAGSHLGRNDFWRLLQEKDIRLYTIGLGEIDRFTSDLASSAKRLLTHAALATNGRGYFSRNSADLATFYREISEEIRKTCTYRMKVTRAQATGTLDVRATGERIATIAAPAQIELILDASGSMKRMIGGRSMIDTAKSVLSDIVRGLPADMRVALRVYGHRLRERQPGACQDSELVFPFGKLDRQQLLTRIQSVRALGTTPIAYSLQQVAKDMGAAGEKMVVLVTDGKEECGGNPAAVVDQLVASGTKLKLNVVGFALADVSLKSELRKLAELTAGTFVDAKDASTLHAAIEQSFAVPYEALDGAGTKVGEGVAGQGRIQLPEGVYTVRVKAEPPIVVDQVRIAAQQGTAIELKKEGREVGVSVAGPIR